MESEQRQSIFLLASEMVRDLTKKQQEVLNFIVSFKRINGRTPTYSEVTKGTTLKYRQNVFQIMNYLEDKGYIKRDNGTISILKDLGHDAEWLASKVRTFKEMLNEGIISEEEYKRYEEDIRKKFLSL